MSTCGPRLQEARDEVLAELARVGNGAAFAVIVTRHRDAVCVIARNMCETLQDAERVVRQTFLSAWSDPGALETDSGFRTSLYRLAMKTALVHRACGSGKPSRPLDPWVPAFDSTGRLEASKGRWRVASADALEKMEIGELLREALQRIDDRGRAAFILRDLLEVPLKEAAVILETSPEVICGEAHRVRLTLRDFIDRL